MFEEYQIQLCLQEMDLEVQEVILTKEQVCSMHPFDGQDLPAELEEAHACVDGITGEQAAEAGHLSQLVMEIYEALVDLGMLPIWDIPHLPKSAQEVLRVAGLLLEHMSDAQASGAGPWD
jgi:hypothetical protein